MSLTITGTVKNINATEQPSEKFSKRVFTIDVQDGNYTNMVALQCVNDKIKLLDNISIGQLVTAHFNLRSREYNGRYYTEATAWKLEAGQQSSQAAPPPLTEEPQSGEKLPF